MQSFIVVASLVLQLAGGGGCQNDPLLGISVSENTLGFYGLTFVKLKTKYAWKIYQTGIFLLYLMSSLKFSIYP